MKEFICDSWVCTFRKNVETKQRERTLAIVKRQNDDLYLVITYVSNWAISFPTWWIDSWDSHIQTLTKELEEETWLVWEFSYKRRGDLDFVRSWYSPHRKRNHKSITYVYQIETISDIDVDAMTEEEKRIQLPSWKSLKEIQKTALENSAWTNYDWLSFLLKNL